MKPEQNTRSRSAFMYQGALVRLASAWLSPQATIGVLLARDTPGYPPNPKHESVSQIIGELDARAASRGYTRKELVGRSANNAGEFLASNVTWSGLRSVETYRWAVLFEIATARPLIAFDLGQTCLRAVTDHTIRWGKGTGIVFSTSIT